MRNVDKRHSDYNKYASMWQFMRDSNEGELAIKSGRDKYLPKLSTAQTDESYNAYLNRAKYYNFVGRVCNIARGQIFRKEPNISGMSDELFKNFDLTGRSLSSFARSLFDEIFIVNRAGVLIDYSVESGRPYAVLYKAENIVNWRTEVIGGELKLTLVVLEGLVNEYNGFDESQRKVWRSLHLENGVYIVRDWTREKDSEEFILTGEQIPIMNNVALDYIPFYFCCNTGINPEVSKPQLYDFAEVNRGLYVNSADYENRLHMTGAVTLVTRGGDENKAIPIGASFNLPTDGGADFLEASTDGGLENAMNKKIEILASLQSAIISGQGRYVQSAQTAQITSEGETATLKDYSRVMDLIFMTLCTVMETWFKGNADITVEFNDDFDSARSTMQEAVQLNGIWSANGITDHDYYINMREMELISKDTTEEQFFAAINAQKKKKVDEFMLSYQQTGQNDQQNNSQDNPDYNNSGVNNNA